MRARSGFSLITVLVITIISLSLMGSIVYIFTATAGSTRVDMAQADQFNIMQSGIEQARALLIEESRTASVPLSCRYNDDPSWTLESLDDLIIRDPSDTDREIGRVISDDAKQIGGHTYSFSVCIYDMHYAADGSTMTGIGDADALRELRASLPPLMSFTTREADDNDPNVLAPNEGNLNSERSGIYLIRATLTPHHGAGAVRVVETAVVQTIGESR